jgi:hypothetical protein
MEENKIWILEGLMMGFLVSQATIVLLYHNYSTIPKCTPELISRSNMYLFVFTVSGIVSFSSALYLKRERTLLIELLVFIFGMAVILSETFCI